MTPLLSFLAEAGRFLLVLGLVVAFHELGHFLAAKLFGIRVKLFSIGFGSRVLGKTIGDTEYRLAVIPLGGYVLMGGDHSDDPEAVRRPDDFDAKPAAMRFAVIAAGPIFSALLTVLLMWGLYMSGVEAPAFVREAPRLGAIADGSPAARAGLATGDVVLSVAGRPTPTWESLTEVLLTSPGVTVDVAVDRAGERLVMPVDVEVKGKHGLGWIGADPCAAVRVARVTPGSPADAAGLLAGDVFESLDGARPCMPGDIVNAVQAAAGKPMTLAMRRGGEIVTLSVAALPDADTGRYLMGISPAVTTSIQRFGPVGALGESLRYTADQSRVVVDILGKLLTGRMSVRAMSGPLEIASITTETASAGLGPLITLIAILSLNIGILNLLPIPILDGGRMLILLIEAVRGRDLERRTKEWILQAGLAMIVLLMVTVIVVDVIKKLEG